MREMAAEKKKSKGTFRKNRDKKVPAIPLSSDTPPKELTGSALDYWQEIAPLLLKRNLLTEADRKLFCTYCIELAKYFEYNQRIEEAGVVLELKNSKGKVVNYMKNPHCDLADKSLKAATSIGTHFGLTPFSRGKLNISDRPAQSPEEKALSQLDKLRGKVVSMKTG